MGYFLRLSAAWVEVSETETKVQAKGNLVLADRSLPIEDAVILESYPFFAGDRSPLPH
jgi:hypothetical protein